MQLFEDAWRAVLCEGGKAAQLHELVVAVVFEPEYYPVIVALRVTQLLFFLLEAGKRTRVIHAESFGDETRAAFQPVGSIDDRTFGIWIQVRVELAVEAGCTQRRLDVVAAANVQRAAIAVERGAESCARSIHRRDVVFQSSPVREAQFRCDAVLCLCEFERCCGVSAGMAVSFRLSVSACRLKRDGEE